MSFLARRVVLAGGGPALQQPAGLACTLLGSCPAIRDYLSLEKHDDGTPRDRATLLVFLEAGMVKVCLSDRSESASFWKAGQDVLDIVTAMEADLQAGRAEWRVTHAKGAKRR